MAEAERFWFWAARNVLTVVGGMVNVKGKVRIFPSVAQFVSVWRLTALRINFHCFCFECAVFLTNRTTFVGFREIMTGDGWNCCCYCSALVCGVVAISYTKCRRYCSRTRWQRVPLRPTLDGDVVTGVNTNESKTQWQICCSVVVVIMAWWSMLGWWDLWGDFGHVGCPQQLFVVNLDEFWWIWKPMSRMWLDTEN